MGIFSKLVKDNRETGFLKILEGFSSVFAPFGRDMLKSDIFLAAAQSNATHRSKLRLIHRRDGTERHLPFGRMLSLRPNPTMNITTFLECLSLDYDTYNNAFIFIDRDLMTGRTTNLWRINPQVMTIGVADDGQLLARFSLQGVVYTVPFDQIAHIAKTITKDELFGDENSALNKILSIINTNYQGIEAAIKTSGVLRYVVKILDKVSPKDIKRYEKEFTKNILTPLNAGGVKYIDGAMELQELRAAGQKHSDFNEQKLYATQVYNFLGTNEKIINGTNTDNEMIAFYERSVDTFALKLSQELTYKIFSEAQKDHHNEIVASPDRLAFMSMSRRIEIARLVRECGIMTKGEYADLLFIPIDEAKRNEPMPLSQNYNQNQEQGGNPNEQDGTNQDPEQKPNETQAQ